MKITFFALIFVIHLQMTFTAHYKRDIVRQLSPKASSQKPLYNPYPNGNGFLYGHNGAIIFKLLLWNTPQLLALRQSPSKDQIMDNNVTKSETNSDGNHHMIISAQMDDNSDWIINTRDEGSDQMNDKLVDSSGRHEGIDKSAPVVRVRPVDIYTDVFYRGWPAIVVIMTVTLFCVIGLDLFDEDIRYHRFHRK